MRLSKNPFAKGFGGKESVKGNRQGFLSRAIRPLFETFCGVSKSETGCRESPVGLSLQPAIFVGRGGRQKKSSTPHGFRGAPVSLTAVFTLSFGWLATAWTTLAGARSPAAPTEEAPAGLRLSSKIPAGRRRQRPMPVVPRERKSAGQIPARH